MGHPASMFIESESGAPIQGSSLVTGREGGLEILQLNHSINTPHDGNTGRLMAGRRHVPLSVVKEMDKASPYLFRAACSNEKFKSVTIKWYRTNDAGLEEEFMNTVLVNAKIVALSPSLHNIKVLDKPSPPTETVALMYESITWRYLDGNIQHTDSWSYGWWGN